MYARSSRDSASKGSSNRARPCRSSRLVRRPGFVASFLALLAFAGVAAALVYRHNTRVRWVRERIVPEIWQLAEQHHGVAAYRLLRQAEREAPNDPAVKELKAELAWPAQLESTPAGARVFARDYTDLQGDWEYLGQTPLKLGLPASHYALKLTNDGYASVEISNDDRSLRMSIVLDSIGSVPADMVHIPAGTSQFAENPEVDLNDFLMDKYEVTNRDFKKFIDSGGYRRTEFWKFPFIKDGHRVSFEQAMQMFRDKTDRSGPSTWELGTFPAGQGNYPVGGLSWYEAAAYAEFSGKSLPTVYHWYRASTIGIYSDILTMSNFSGKGPAPVGSYRGLGPYGTYDMAGNVKEWCFNASGDRRYILGGASTEPVYMYQQADARSPFDRTSTNGVRLVKYLRGAPAESLTAPVSVSRTDYRKVKPVSDQVFQIYKSLYSYDRTPLEPRIESQDDSLPDWTRQRITFNAAYEKERVIAYLYLPKVSSPPYQTVVYFPMGAAQILHSFDDSQLWATDFLIRSGRALMFPIYKGSYERLDTVPDAGTSAERDLEVQEAKDLRRSVDYLETRSDIDHDRLAYYGLSWGGEMGTINLAVEDRLKVGVLVAGGCDDSKVLPEADPFNFAPHVKVPMLMLNGRYDFDEPLETCQEPLFRALGTPPRDKRHILFEAGHSPPFIPVFKETLDWLDHYLGPVK
jgi:eukaryotic-like serine/threonine-protein kinase